MSEKENLIDEIEELKRRLEPPLPEPMFGWCSKHNIMVRADEKCPACEKGLPAPEPVILNPDWKINLQVTEDDVERGEGR